ncbi:unnamed protein product [Onchocerca flexuosa]|uniref:Uncharacterized protein n=1 Tax=Onchocerca flexuosa TaxID=387005 RepID=A0A183HVG2_9BILA|nr:unnamed protein product [Onchocerca flexuosa]
MKRDVNAFIDYTYVKNDDQTTSYPKIPLNYPLNSLSRGSNKLNHSMPLRRTRNENAKPNVNVLRKELIRICSKRKSVDLKAYLDIHFYALDHL